MINIAILIAGIVVGFYARKEDCQTCKETKKCNGCIYN